MLGYVFDRGPLEERACCRRCIGQLQRETWFLKATVRVIPLLVETSLALTVTTVTSTSRYTLVRLRYIMEHSLSFIS